MPLVSIALCTYNGAKYLPEQLDGLLAQTYPNIEIVAVDDGSTDDTAAILHSYAARHPDFKVFQNDENLGYVKNFERAINLCSGDYIALADQDDIWQTDKIETLFNNIGSNMLIYHDSEMIDEQGQPLNRKLSDVRNFYAGTNANVFLMENCVSGHALMFRRPLLHFLDGFKKNVFHDWWLAYAACNTGGVTYIKVTLVKYRQHTQANTNILQQERQPDGKDTLTGITEIAERAAAFAAYPHNKNQAFKTQFARLTERSTYCYFNFTLFWFIFNNRESLLFVKKKSTLSKFNYSLKFAWGYKLRTLFK